MTEYVTLEDWVALVFGYLEDLTLDDLHDKAASILIEMLYQRPIADEKHYREVAALSASLFLSVNGHRWHPAKDELPYWVAEADAGRLNVRTLGRAIAEHCQPPARPAGPGRRLAQCRAVPAGGQQPAFCAAGCATVSLVAAAR